MNLLTAPQHSMRGAATGPVVVVLDEALGAEADVPAAAAGVRLLVARTAADLPALVDALALPTVGILARGAGLATAMTAAASLPGRVRAVSVLDASELPLAMWVEPSSAPAAALLDAALRFAAAS
jgi:pimeloyl-ACP methyl ester carboxylesterase